MTAQDSYYWAGGERVRLRAEPDVAVDLEAVRRSGLDADDVRRLADQGRSLGGSLVLLAEEQLPDSLATSAGVHPVYRAADGSLVVVLPEVRVEDDDPARLAGLRSLVPELEPAATVSESRPGRLVVTPASGRGEDALTLANRLAEREHPQVAQARFLRVVPRPAGPGRPPPRTR